MRPALPNGDCGCIPMRRKGRVDMIRPPSIRLCDHPSESTLATSFGDTVDHVSKFK
jgi:hypothetical protein